jgi:hypothetical protein
MDINNDWPAIKRLFRKSFSSSFHFAVSTVTENGEPHVTPIGSLILGAPGHGFYFEEFPNRLPSNLERNPHLCVLAVNSSRWFWLRSLVKGRFEHMPAVRLRGKAGDTRAATEKEIALWQKRVKPVRFTKGHELMWRSMRTVRDIEFTSIEPIHIGRMTGV